MSTEPTWRVYQPEWLTVYVPDGQEDGQKAWDRFAAVYQGRVRDEDVRVLEDPHVQLQVRLPNLKGEFKDRDEAMDWYIQLPHAQLVQRGSEQEKELLAYGKKMLPDAG